MKSDSVSTQGKWPHLHGFALFAVDGPWSVKVESDGRETILDVEPPDRIAVSAERHDELPVFDATKPAYCRGKALNGVAARGCSVRWALEPESVEVRAASDGRVLARAVVVAHNHPDGDPAPSDDDFAVTERLVEAGRILGIKLLDHLVLGSGGANGSPSFVFVRALRPSLFDGGRA